MSRAPAKKGAERHKVEVSRDDDVVGRVEGWVGLIADVADVAVDDVDFDAWIELLEVRVGVEQEYELRGLLLGRLRAGTPLGCGRGRAQ